MDTQNQTPRRIKSKSSDPGVAVLGVTGLFCVLGAIGYTVWADQGRPSASACQVINGLQSSLGAAADPQCAPINWVPFWLLIGVGVGLALFGMILRRIGPR